MLIIQLRACLYWHAWSNNVALPNFERHGPQRPLESYAGIRFERRMRKNDMLEIRDLKGIRHPRRPLPSEPKVWRERSHRAGFDQQYQALKCIVHPLRITRNRFSLYSPVDNSKSVFRHRPGRGWPCTHSRKTPTQNESESLAEDGPGMTFRTWTSQPPYKHHLPKPARLLLRYVRASPAEIWDRSSAGFKIDS